MALRLPGNVVIVVLFNQRVAVSGAPMDAISTLMERAAAKVQAWPAENVKQSREAAIGRSLGRKLQES
jgi:hypothetical protein